MLGAVWLTGNWRLFILITILTIAVANCNQSPDGKKRKLSDTGKRVFFTDRRPFDRKLIDEDIQRLTEAISQSPQTSRLLVARGFIYAALTDFQKAIRDFEQAAAIDPSTDIADPRGPKKNGVHYLLALAHWQNGNLNEAIKYFSSVIQQNPDHARSRFYRGLASLEAGKVITTLDDIQTAISMENERMYAQVLSEIKGERSSKESIFASYVISFHANKPPQNRPFGYVWEIQHKVHHIIEIKDAGASRVEKPSDARYKMVVYSPKGEEIPELTRYGIEVVDVPNRGTTLVISKGHRISPSLQQFPSGAKTEIIELKTGKIIFTHVY
jgi:tetratricopeptide (TPR) repeat protein